MWEISMVTRRCKLISNTMLTAVGHHEYTIHEFTTSRKFTSVSCVTIYLQIVN